MNTELTTQEKSRRDFLSKLALGSVSGLVIGSAGKALGDDAKKVPVILQDPNVCRGLNTCKGKGKGEHDCAGMGACATAEAHDCSGSNACKGQGGCGTTAGQNECKGAGKCAVPLNEKAWTKARAAFEEAAKAAGMKVGPAPAAA
ncbi:MAG: hypothetical protein P1V20_22685 [Verrucomicrobiales bacterium]|nr:hypothetical protein [Verrucomicrobiales bacterium]